MKRLWMILGSLAMAVTAAATTYVRVEKDGTKTYSDRPIPGGTPVELQPAQSYSAPAGSQAQSSVPREQQLLQDLQADNFRYESCTLSPDNQATFTNPDSVSITLQSTPGLRAEDRVSMTINGQAVSADGGSHTLSGPVNRGNYAVQVLVRDRFGRQLCSASTTFNVFRPSVNMPRR